MTGLNGSACLRRSERALSRRVGIDVLVTTPGDEDIHELSGGASAVWAGLQAPRTVPELIARLAADHGVDPADIAEEVSACVEHLRALGVVEEMRDHDG